MPPQLLAKDHPTVEVLPVDDVFACRPAVAVAVARCISDWVRVETELGRLFMGLLGKVETLHSAAALWSSFANNNSRSSAINAVVLSLDQPESSKRIFNAIMRHKASEQKIRDKIAHWIWMYSPQLPDGLVLVNPKSFLEGDAKIVTLMSEDYKRQNDMNIYKDAWFSDAYYYTSEWLANDAANFKHLSRLLGKVGMLLHLGEDALPHLYHELKTDARLAPILSPRQNIHLVDQ